MKFVQERRSTEEESSDFSLVLPNGVTLDTSDDIEVVFKCIYAMSVNVKSTNFSVERLKSSWDSTSNGELDSGFAMILDDYVKWLGSPLSVSATWSLQLPTLQFYFENCFVQVDAASPNAMKVEIIRDGCYSAALHVSRQPGTTKTQGFVFPTFAVEGEEKSTQVMNKSGLYVRQLTI